MHVIDWLMDSDPAIRWQVKRDLADAPDHDVAAERARVATEGWGARLLDLQRHDGHWDKSTPSRAYLGGGDQLLCSMALSSTNEPWGTRPMYAPPAFAARSTSYNG